MKNVLNVAVNYDKLSVNMAPLLHVQITLNVNTFNKLRHRSRALLMVAMLYDVNGAAVFSGDAVITRNVNLPFQVILKRHRVQNATHHI